MKKILLFLFVAFSISIIAHSNSDSKTNQATYNNQVENLCKHLDDAQCQMPVFETNNRYCPKCGGNGYFQCNRCRNNGYIDCRSCNGRGTINGKSCNDCYGKGKVLCDYPGCEGGHIKCGYCDGEGVVD